LSHCLGVRVIGFVRVHINVPSQTITSHVQRLPQHADTLGLCFDGVGPHVFNIAVKLLVLAPSHIAVAGAFPMRAVALDVAVNQPNCGWRIG